MGSAICRPQVLNPVLLHCRQILYRLSHHRSPIFMYPKFKNHWNKLYILPQIKPISVFSLFLKTYLKIFFFNLQNFSRVLDILCTNLEMILDRFRPSLLFILYIKAFKGKQLPTWTFQVAQWWRTHLPMQETQEMQVWSLGWEEPLEEKMAAHSSILAWRIPWTEEPGRLQSVESQRVGHDLESWTCTHAHTSHLQDWFH